MTIDLLTTSQLSKWMNSEEAQRALTTSHLRGCFGTYADIANAFQLTADEYLA